MQVKTVNIKCYQSNKKNHSNSTLELEWHLEVIQSKYHFTRQKLFQFNRFAPSPTESCASFNQPIYHEPRG